MEQQQAVARATERRQRRYPVPDLPLPPLDRVVMTHLKAVIFTDVTGELADDSIVKAFYPAVSTTGATLIWAVAQADPQRACQSLANPAGAGQDARMVAADHR